MTGDGERKKSKKKLNVIKCELKIFPQLDLETMAM